jgi:dTDP-4-amino-4,6-dideoxygalactose transaminase
MAIPFQPAYAQLGYRRGQFPIAESVARCCISLPMFPEMTDEQISYVAQSLRSILAESMPT